MVVVHHFIHLYSKTIRFFSFYSLLCRCDDLQTFCSIVTNVGNVIRYIVQDINGSRHIFLTSPCILNTLVDLHVFFPNLVYLEGFLLNISKTRQMIPSTQVPPAPAQRFPQPPKPKFPKHTFNLYKSLYQDIRAHMRFSNGSRVVGLQTVLSITQKTL